MIRLQTHAPHTYLCIPDCRLLRVTRLHHAFQLYVISNFELVHRLHLEDIRVVRRICIVDGLKVPDLQFNANSLALTRPTKKTIDINNSDNHDCRPANNANAVHENDWGQLARL